MIRFPLIDPDDVAQVDSKATLFVHSETGLPALRNEAGDVKPFLAGIAQWRRQGTVLEPTAGSDIGGIQEISVIWEDGPIILADLGSEVFKAWFTGGFGSPRGICYAESYDGLTWERHSTVAAGDYVLDGYVHSSVIKSGSTYYLFGVTEDSLQCDAYTSPDGITWTIAKLAIVEATGVAGWERTYIGNVFPIYEGGVWKLIYEALGDTGDHSWALGLTSATSVAGTWTKSTANPVLTRDAGHVSGPYIKKIGDLYWMWAHSGLGNESDIYRWYSADLVTWAQNQTSPVLGRGIGDGMMSEEGQVADPWVVEANGKTYMFYEGTPHGGNVFNRFRGKVAIADHPFAELVLMEERADAQEAEAFGKTGNRVRFMGFLASATAITDGNFPNMTFTDSSFRGNNGATMVLNGWDSGKTTWTVPRFGWYRIRFQAYLTVVSAAGTKVTLGILQDGNYITGGFFQASVHANTDTPTFAIDATVLLNPGDELTFRVYPVGGNITVSNDGIGTFISVVEEEQG